MVVVGSSKYHKDSEDDYGRFSYASEADQDAFY